MTDNHVSYTPMDVEKPWAEDPSLDVSGKKKNKFINRAFAWMYHVAVSDAQGALTWLLPSASLDVDAAVDELCQRIFLDEQADETLLLGPVLLASFAYAIMISPWYTFRHMKDKPPTDTWFRQQLEYYGQWPVSNVNQRISDALKSFYREFPDARSLASRRKSGSLMHCVDSPKLSGNADAATMPIDDD